MAIIYTYPVKSSLASADLILISDSADGNKTKQVAASSLPGFSGQGIENLGVSGSTQNGATQLLASGNSFITIASSNDTHTFGINGALPAANGGTGLSALGTRNQILQVNSAANALEYIDPALTEIVKNNTGSTITKGTPVYISGVSGSTPTIATANATNSSTMPVVGLLAEDIANNTDGLMIVSGILEGIRTNDLGGAAGDIVYVGDTAGATTVPFLTTTKPNGTALIQNIGIIIKNAGAGAGSIQVAAIGRSNDLPNFGTPGAIWQGDTNGVPSTLALGTNGHVLTANTSTERAQWSALPASADSISFGTTGLTPNSATTGAITVAGTLVAANGGTGQNSYPADGSGNFGQILYASGTTTLSPLGIGSAGQTLVVNGAGNAPEWSSAAGTGTVTSVAASGGTTGLTFSGSPITTSGTLTIGGTLGIANGGTGLTAVGSRRGYVLKTRGSIAEWVSRDGFPATLTSAAAVTWNYANNSSAYFLLGSGNADVLSISNIEDGDQGVLILDGSASTTFQLPHNGSTILSKFASGGSYTPSANIDVLRFIARISGGVTTFYWTITANMQNYTP
jgi:hypothetical protein